MASAIPLSFNHLLTAAGLDLADVRLMRHSSRFEGTTIYDLWHRDRVAFEHFQRTHDAMYRSNLAAPYWASFVQAPSQAELFVGLYSASFLGPVPLGWRHAMSALPMNPNTADLYDQALTTLLGKYLGRLFIDWGTGGRYIQRADRQEKLVVEIAATSNQR